MIDIDSLRCFVAAADAQTFRAAAGRVALSPAAFSDRIKRLEDSLGAPLFHRTTRKVGLTAAGERLLPQARRTLAEAARCMDVVADDEDPPVRLTLGTRFELGLSWVLPAVAALEVEAPSWTINLVFGDTPDLLAALKRGQVDAVVGSMRLVASGLVTVPIHDEAYAFVASPTLLADRPLASAEDAGAHVLVDISADLPLFRYWRDQAPAEELWSFSDVRYLGTIGAIRQWAIEGRGVAVLPRYFVAPQLAAGELVAVMPQVQPRSDWFRLVWRDGHLRSEPLRRLAAFLKGRPLT